MQSPMPGSMVSAEPTLSKRDVDASPTVGQTADGDGRLPAQSPRATLTDSNHIRLVGSNIRVPQGIPVPQRGFPPRENAETAPTSSDSNANAADVCDTNPLRRLREVNTFRPVTTSVNRYK